jgi:dTDP-4-amino-4,6-dideoxygalactose transaminase
LEWKPKTHKPNNAVGAQRKGKVVSDPQLMRDISRLLKSGQLSPFFKRFEGGPYVQKFEKAFGKYVGTKYAVTVANGTLALNAAYAAANFPAGSEIITTPWTFVATVSEIVRAGHRPVFADVHLETGALDPESVAAKITPNSRCVVPMHPLGVSCDMDGLKQVSGDLLVCEDSCQALGSVYHGRMCGSFGDLACFSLQQTKSLNTGEGGVVVTSNEELCDRLRHIRNHGNKYGTSQERFKDIVATNYRLTEIHALIGLHGLKAYAKVVKEQLERFRILYESLEASTVFLPQETYPNSTRNGYIIGSRLKPEISNPEDVRKRFLEKNSRFNRSMPGYVVGPGYSELVYDLPAFQKFKVTEHPCPNAEELWRRSIWFDARKMPKEIVKALGREIEKFRT